MATHGTLGEFNLTREDWTSYTERLELLYFTPNDVVTEKKQQVILLSVCGAETYKPTEKTFAELVKIENHHQPTPSTIVQRFYFNT